MGKITIPSLVAVVVLLTMLFGSLSFAVQEPDKTKRKQSDRLFKPTGTPRWQILNINNLWTWAESNGESNHSPKGDNGTYFPRGTRWVIYKDGIKWGGKCHLDAEHTQPAPYGQTIRVGGCDYLNGTRAGRVIGFGANAERVDPGDPDVRIYRIRRDYASMSEAELKQDAAESFEMPLSQVPDADMQAIYDQYERDWNEWPVDQGAPFIDRNGNGVYDPPPPFRETFTVDSLIAGGYDEPGIAGGDLNSPADQVLWNVYNDLDRSKTLALDGSEPMGLELQRTVWGYKRTGPLGQIYFTRTKIINKGGVDIDDAGTKGSFWIDSMYVGQWSDPDVGAFFDDLVGCDTLLNMGFAYNARAIDKEYAKYDLPPPSVGYDLLQGPIVPSQGDQAVFDSKIKKDFRNLPMTSFSSSTAGGMDPRNYNWSLRWYNTLRGYAPIDGPPEFYPFPPGMKPNKFPLSGDPVTGTGFIDGLGEAYSLPPGDRRFVSSSGPFTLAPGDTQEVVIAVVCGLGADRLSSISMMKFNDRFAQAAYDGFFQIPSPPTGPKVNVTELDGRVILEWGSDPVRVANTETMVHEAGGYVFEGYNVYQFPRRSSSLSNAKRIATYDLPTDPAVIMDEYLELSSNQILKRPVQFGSNSGIKRYFEFDRDYVLDIDKIYNGQEYFLAVTAYSRPTVPGYLPAALESPPTILTVVPKVPFGVVYHSYYGDTLSVMHTAGSSDGAVFPIIIDPTLSTGDTCEVGFEETDGTTTWKLTNTTDNQVLLSGQRNQSGDDEYPIADGLFIKVIGPPLEGKSWSTDPPANRWFTGAGSGELLYGGVYLHPTFSGGSATDPADFKIVEIRFVTKTGYTDLNRNREYDIGEPYTLPEVATQKAFMYTTWDDESYTGFFDVPFTAWDVQDPANPRQLNAIVLDRDDNHQWDLHSQVDDAVLPNGGDQRYNYIWIAGTDYDETDALHAAPSHGGTGWPGDDATQPGLWVLWLGPCGTKEPYGEDVTLTLVPNFVNIVNDVFTFTVPEPTTGAEQERFSADRVGVFPNPYYAFNPAETHRLARFVTFNNLPPKATIRIFNLAGQLVMKLRKDDPSQFLRWDLLNHDALPVASGMYIAHVAVELPSGGKATKVLKLAIIQEQEMLDVY